MPDDEKKYCRICGKESDTGLDLCDDCFNDAHEKERDSRPGGLDDPDRY